MVRHRRDAAKEAFWRDVLGRQAASGLSVRAFCVRESLKESAFHFWRRTIIQRSDTGIPESAASVGGTDIRQRAKNREGAVPTFVPARLTDVLPARDSSDDTTDITIELAGGRLLRLPQSISTARLAELVLALEAHLPVVRGG